MFHISPEHWCYLVGIGSNLPTPVGSPQRTVSWALETLGERPDWRVFPSRLFRSPAYPPGANPDFVNAAAVVHSPLSPDRFLQFAHEIERDCNRVRSKRWAPRTLDIDVIACENLVHPDSVTLDHWMKMPEAVQQISVPDQLILPHPRMHQRSFVLLPLLDVAANWVHPVLQKTVEEMVNELPEEMLDGVEPL